NENLQVQDVRIPSSNSSYTLDLLVNNAGNIMVNVARIYLYNQSARYIQTSQTLTVYNPQNGTPSARYGTGKGFINGTINPGEVRHVIPIDGTLIDYSKIYQIILATDRGREFTYIFPQNYLWGGAGGGGGGYPLMIVSDHDDFQYVSKIQTAYANAYVKPVEIQSSDQLIYRIYLNNTTNKHIIMQNNSTMLQLDYSGNSMGSLRYIVDPGSTCSNPIAFNTQIIYSHQVRYVYFAASTLGSPFIAFVGDPSGNDKYYLVGFLLSFKYYGETEIRNVSTPAIIQNLK
ncbi:hypothetical protein MUP37_04050, partial [Candidatus Bathyarchaeota archaeon]|nr:hypothetical protein [Candidatus Bathyarchaeota archaeon]